MNEQNLRKWPKGVSGNPKGRAPLLPALAELARGEINKHQLIERLGKIASGAGRINLDHQLRAIQMLLAYGYGPPRGELELPPGGSVHIEVTYVDRALIAAAVSPPAPPPAVPCIGPASAVQGAQP